MLMVLNEWKICGRLGIYPIHIVILLDLSSSDPVAILEKVQNFLSYSIIESD